MNKSTLIAKIVRLSGLPTSTARKVLDEVIKGLAVEFRRSAQIRVPGLGTFGVAGQPKPSRPKARTKKRMVGRAKKKAAPKKRSTPRRRAAAPAPAPMVTTLTSGMLGSATPSRVLVKYRPIAGGDMSPEASTHGSGGGRND